MGSIKSVGGIDVYVKNDHCEESVKELIKLLKFDDSLQTKLILGTWEFLQKDLLPLLIFHDKDKKLSFLTLMLLVQLTESTTAPQIHTHQLAYKQSFLE